MGCICSFTGIPRDCSTSTGGIRRAWIGCYDEVSVTLDITKQKISEITALADTFKEFVFRKQTGSVTSTVNKDDATGSLFFESEITLQFLKQETAKRIEIASLAVSDVVVIIEDSNGRFWYFGYTNPVNLSTGTAETGTAMGDFNGYNVTLLDQSAVMPYEVEASAMEEIM